MLGVLNVSAWFYYRGKLRPVADEHTDPIAAIAKGKARLRYHEESETLAVQARSRRLCQAAVALYLDTPGLELPGYITAQWPGVYHECPIQDWQ